MSVIDHTVVDIHLTGFDTKARAADDALLALTAHRMTFQRLMIQVQLAGDTYYRAASAQSHTADTDAVLYDRMLDAIEALEQHVTTRPCSTGETR